MKYLTYWKLGAVCLCLGTISAAAQYFGAMGGGESENHITLIIKADGSSTLTNATVQGRKGLEMQVTSWERYSKRAEGMSSEDEEPPVVPPPPAPSPTKALTSEELAAKIRAMYQQRSENAEDEELQVDTVEVSSNSVRLVYSRAFASLKELMSQSPYTWGPSALMFEDARFESDTNRNLSLVFTPAKGTDRYAREMSRGWKSSKAKLTWMLVLPGKILSSGLPGIQDNATWLDVDGEKPETVEAALKLIGAPLVISAEPAGLKLDEPLDSKKLVRAAWKHRKAEPDLPITDAAAGFLAEPVGLSLSTIHTFPEGEKYFKDSREAALLGMESSGTLVSAKLFPPKGREIKSFSGVRVKAAKDDQGRAIAGAGEESDEDESDNEPSSFRSGDSEKVAAVQFDIHLALPAADAKTIDTLEAEGIALTIGGWKELVLTNVQADAKKEIDLAAVLPGAKLIIKKMSGKASQKTVEASVEGPATVSQLEVKAKLSSRHSGSSNFYERKTSTSGNKTTRNLTIQSYEFDPAQESKDTPLTLVIRYPQDIKRERVQFKLTALDLL